MRLSSALLTAAAATLLLAGCNTVAGAGKDLSIAGKAMEQSSNKVAADTGYGDLEGAQKKPAETPTAAATPAPAPATKPRAANTGDAPPPLRVPKN